MTEHSASSFNILVSDKHGSVTAAVTEAKQPRAIMTLGHGAGTNMHHKSVVSLATALAEAGVTTVRFNFPYSEQGKKMPDRFPVASATVRAVIAEVHSRFPGVPFFAGGKSFGGRMSSQTLAESCPEFVRGIVFYGFPLHPSNSPSVDRAVHLAHVPVPMLFIQGMNDTLAEPSLIKEVCAGLPRATLIHLEGVDHSFTRGKQSTPSSLARLTCDWLENKI